MCPLLVFSFPLVSHRLSCFLVLISLFGFIIIVINLDETETRKEKPNKTLISGGPKGAVA